jgi:hypothetical protein
MSHYFFQLQTFHCLKKNNLSFCFGDLVRLVVVQDIRFKQVNHAVNNNADLVTKILSIQKTTLGCGVITCCAQKSCPASKCITCENTDI